MKSERFTVANMYSTRHARSFETVKSHVAASQRNAASRSVGIAAWAWRTDPTYRVRHGKPLHVGGCRLRNVVRQTFLHRES